MSAFTCSHAASHQSAWLNRDSLQPVNGRTPQYRSSSLCRHTDICSMRPVPLVQTSGTTAPDQCWHDEGQNSTDRLEMRSLLDSEADCQCEFHCSVIFVVLFIFSFSFVCF